MLSKYAFYIDFSIYFSGKPIDHVEPDLNP